MRNAPDSAASPSTILIVDDVPETLALIAEMLSGTYRCKVAASGEKALAIAKSAPRPDLILLDIDMPEMDGYGVCARLKKEPVTADIPVMFLTALDSDDDEAKGFAAGVVDYVTKPVSKAVLNARVSAQLALLQSRRFLERKNELLESMVIARSQQISTMQDVIILAMASLAESKDSDTGAHIRRVQAYTRALAVALRKNPDFRDRITDETLELLYKTSPLHDIGKVGVPDMVLFKPGRLSRDEFDAMKLHAYLGSQTLMEVERQLATPAAFVTMAHEIALHHHERWDGGGYPLGLCGEEIPLSARLVTLADTYDALTTARIYKPPYPVEEACRMIERERGLQFDPAVVDAFRLCTEEFQKIAAMYPDPVSESGRSIILRHLMDGQA